MSDDLKNRLNPLVSLAASWNASLGEKISPCLSATELAPIPPDNWLSHYGSMMNQPNVIFVKIESLRHDVVNLRHQGLEVMPQLNALAHDGLHLTRAYSPTTHTDYSDVSVLSSLYPLRSRLHHYYEATDPWPKTLIYDVLKSAGYATAIVSAENFGWGRMDKFLVSPYLDLFYDAERSGAPTRLLPQDSGFAHEVRAGGLRAGLLDDQLVTDTALDWISAQVSRSRPFFLYLDLQSSHFPYLLPSGTESPFQPSTINFNVSFVSYPIEKTEVVRNAYYNGAHECDKQLGRLVTKLRELDKLKNTILVIYGDHGEAFHENGYVTHAGQPIEPVARTACVLYAPRFILPKVEDYPVELTDLVPTVLGLMGLPTHPNFQGINFLATSRPPLERRLLFLHTETPLSRSDVVLLAGRWKYFHDRNSGQDSLYDLQSDPQTLDDVALQHPLVSAGLRAVLVTWRQRQLAYYHFPFYYESYYPPQPPQWSDDADAR